VQGLRCTGGHADSTAAALLTLLVLLPLVRVPWLQGSSVIYLHRLQQQQGLCAPQLQHARKLGSAQVLDAQAGAAS
jgi:hypothetical protein